MSEIKSFFSSGGVGDNWIHFLKILPYTTKHQIRWHNVNSHKCHLEPIAEIQSWTPNLYNNRSILLTGNKKINMKDREQKFRNMHPHMVRLNSKACELNNPCPNLDFLPYTFKASEPYIVVQGRAGRKDNSSREFTASAIEQIALKYKRKVILLGMKPDKDDHIECSFLCKGIQVGDLRGKVSLLHSFSLIYNCEKFIGHDGVLAYFAMSLKKDSMVVFHLPNLPSHYMHRNWCANTKIMFWPKDDYNKRTIINNIKKIQKLY
jgi:ADP-heptose:LPS heptosyltransferase